MDAQGALDSLLGRLTTILVDEARLLGGLQGDVEFINDEMESMNGLILHLTEAHHRDHQVRAWMKQVVGLTRDCEGNVELYIHSVTDAGHHDSGFLGYLGRIVRYVRTIPERRRTATRIRELKVRARDVGDRKLRYDVTVPPAAADQDDAIFMGDIQASHGSEDEDEDLRRRALLVNCPDDQQPYVQKTIDDIIKSLLPQEGPVVELSQGESQLKIFLLTWDEYRSYGSACGVDHSYTKLISRKLYEQKMSSFSCKAFVTMNSYSYMEVQGIKYAHPECKSLVQILREILHQVAPILVEQDVLMVEAEKDMETSLLGDGKEDEATQLIKKLEGFLKGKQLLIIFQDVYSKEDWNSISSAMLHATARGSPGSAIVITTKSADLIDLESPSPYKIFKLRSPFHAFYNKTVELAKCSGRFLAVGIGDILGLCYTDFFAMKMVLHLLYVNPRRGITQVDNIVAALNGCLASNRSVGKQMVKISYNELPTKYRSCLLSLTIFPEGDRIRRTTMCRRWIAEGLITSKENRAEDEADCCFEALFSWGLILPVEVNEMGKMKACTLHPVVREVITRIARDLNFVDTDLPTHLARHLPVHNRTGAQASHTDRCVQADNDNGIVAFLPYLAKSSQWQLMKILDLESCRGLKKQHLKSICKIILLKYLSLRNTDITELPKQIEKLQCLETLDIRETEVQAFATRSIMLPMLKHLLSGQTKSPSNIFDSSQDFRTAVRLPSGIRRMARLEILSHVDASHSVNDLTDVGHLLQLRKLGVILRGKKCGLGLLFLQIENLHGCIRSLSIQIYQPVSKTEDVSCAEEVVTLASPPKLLQSLKISGIRSGLLIWIAELDQLTKITLSETYLAEDYMRILGKLRALRCLRLRRNSYAGSRLTFKEEEFENLKSLAVDDGTITGITFDSKAAPKLETIVWSFAKMEYISGLLCLPKLKNVELNGDCDSDPVRQELEEHTNYPEFKHKPRHGQEDGVVVALSPP